VIIFIDNFLVIFALKYVHFTDKIIKQFTKGAIMSDVQILKHAKVVSTTDEWITTNYGLPTQWRGVKSVHEQIGNLSALLETKLDAETRKFVLEGLPRWFELEWPGWIDGFFVCLNPLVDYCANLSEKIMPALAKRFANSNCVFCNFLEDNLGDDRLRLNSQTIEAYENMAKIQKGNFWVIPMSLANFKRYPGKTCSPRRYLELAGQGEFGIGPSEGLCAALTHFQERITSEDVLRMHFPGAKYDYRIKSDHWTTITSLSLGLSDLGQNFNARNSDDCGPYATSVLGCLPSQELLC
jgi:hypothetical protein